MVVPQRQPTSPSTTMFGMTGRQQAVLHITAPFLAWSAFAGLLWAFLSWPTFITLLSLMLMYMVPPAGVETIVPLGILHFHIHPVLMALAIAWEDIVIGLFVILNFDVVKKVPFLGPWIRDFEAGNAKTLAKRTWMTRGAFVGLIAFTIVPFQGAGGAGTAVLGRVIGMRPWTVFAAVAVGSVGGALLVAYIALYMAMALLSSSLSMWVRAAIGIAIAVAIIGYLVWTRPRSNRGRTHDR